MLESLSATPVVAGVVPADLVIQTGDAPTPPTPPTPMPDPTPPTPALRNIATRLTTSDSPFFIGQGCRIADRGNKANCERGNGDHPADWWRIEDMRNELIKHASDYAKIRSPNPQINVFGDQLTSLQAAYFKQTQAQWSPGGATSSTQRSHRGP